MVEPSAHKPVFYFMKFKAGYAVGIDMTDLYVSPIHFN